MEKILTISIAAYNAEKYIEKALSSLVCCKMNELEVMVIDDGSTDETFSIAKEFELRYPKTFQVIHKSNGGYGSTINCSIERATGKYFKQLDADDWYHTENLDSFLHFLENTDSDIVITPFYKVFEKDNHKEMVDSHSQIKPSSQAIDSIRLSDRLMMHELAIKTSVLQSNDIKITVNCFYTDNEYVFEPLIHSDTVSRYKKPIYCYRVGLDGQSVSINSIRIHYSDIKKVAFKLYGLFNAFMLSEGDKNKGKYYILKRMIQIVTIGVYTYYLATGDPIVYYNELKKIDKEMRQKYPSIFKMTFISKRIILLRCSNFILAPIISKKMISERSRMF